jgi:hypothetical protein
MSDNLGVYNNNYSYDGSEPMYDNNNHIEQGVNFMKYSKLYDTARGNKHSLLFETSSPNIGSIAEAFQGSEESVYANSVVIRRAISDDETEFNALLSEYSTLYNTYTTSLLKTNPTATDLAQRKVMEEQLRSKSLRLAVLANSIQTNIYELSKLGEQPGSDVVAKNAYILRVINEISKQKNDTENKIYYDTNTVDGKIETSTLNTNSIQLNYIIYFILAITIIAFTINIILNPNADVTTAIYVVSALIVIYIFSRWVI